MTLYTRGSNPVWSYVDLTGNQLDDTYYLFVLQNDLPYLPATVYHDADGNIAWTNPIQFLANGTLPIDIFFDPDTVYRLEIRQGNTQADALIYLIENYVPGGSGSPPVDVAGLFTDNQITNPQFSVVSFASPFTLSATNPAPIEVAPGWFLELTGTGTVALEQVALNSTTANPTNAPYMLRITLSGSWTGTPYLRQRFQQNGMLWANKYVSSSVTARVEGAPQSISAHLYDSLGQPLTSVLDSTPVNDTFNEYRGYGLVPATSNTNTPPNAYIDYKLALPTNVDIYVSSFQLIASDVEIEFPYEQDTIDRQIDHTFHYYKHDLIINPKESILVGWNFPLNPWQFYTTSLNTITTPEYTADQTVFLCENNSSLRTVRSSDGFYAITPVAATAQGKFGIIQYIDSSSVLPYWAHVLSSLLRASFASTNGTQLKIKMRILYRNANPVGVNPISSWNAPGVDPTFSAGWTAVAPINDPVYTVSSAYTDYAFNAFQLPALPAVGAMVGVLIYTDNAMSSAGTPDTLYISRVGLTPGEFACDATPQSFDQCLAQCQYYYEKSYPPFVLPGEPGSAGSLFAEQLGINSSGTGTGVDTFRTRGFGIRWNRVKRTTPSVFVYAQISAAFNSVSAFLKRNGLDTQLADIPISNWSALFNSRTGIEFLPANGTAFGPIAAAGDGHPEGFIDFHYVARALIGIEP